jgi:elongation factor G
MHKIMEEDPTVHLHVDGELHQHVLQAMGELHMDVVMEKLRERHVEVELKRPRIHFRETIKRPAEGQGKYKKQTGGRGQYGDVWLKLKPLTHGAGFQFNDEVVGGVVPGKFIPAVEKGVVEAMKEGVVAGYPVVDIDVTIFDGSHHSVDSSEQAFKVAGSMAFKKLMQEATPVLLEPIMEVEVTVPEEYTGDIMGDLSSRRGKILGIEPRGRVQAVRALVPEAEMYRYGAQLRSLTQGRARFTMKFHAREEVPRDQAERVIQTAKAAREQSEGS